MSARLDKDQALKLRAKTAFPNSVYGHQSTRAVSTLHPQFFKKAQGAKLWDVDGNEYIDYMCGYGTNLLGYCHPAVDEAAAKQQATIDVATGPSETMLLLAEKFNEKVAHADWTMFAKNGGDATTVCVMTARAQTGKSTILVAEGAYHGACPWATPAPAGVAPGDKMHQVVYQYNNIESLRTAVEIAGGDLAAIVVTPFKHNARCDQELPTQEFAEACRALCDAHDAALILDDVRCAFRFTLGATWELLGVLPDLCAMSKSVANGYSLSVVTGNNRFREGASSIYTTGSFWFASVSFAASLATVQAVEEESAIEKIKQSGDLLRRGLAEQAVSAGFEFRQTGPVQMPLFAFNGDEKNQLINRFCEEAVVRGVYMHPWHNMFISAAHTPELIASTLQRTEEVFTAMKNDR